MIHDTLRGKKVKFRPRKKGEVRIYVCGPTVYDLAHIGNARPVVVFDVFTRLLRRLYPKVTYVRNITDVDDKINAAAKETGESIQAITERTTKIFHDDMAALGNLPPDEEPKATEHIDGMKDLVAKLIESGHAYEGTGEAEGHVLFSVPSMGDDYGKLSKLKRDELVAGARVEAAPYKQDPADFILWKPSPIEDDLPGWDSPWGRGRPGWHLECSVMSEKFLGPEFDIHGGGQDLIFPHHENEIAQSTCTGGGKDGGFAKYWMHNGYLMAEGEKMSKSLGNFYTVHELLDEFPGEAIRLALLKTHYRQPLDFTKDGLAEAKRELDGFYGALRKVTDVRALPSEPSPASKVGLLDDLNTPLAISHLHRCLKLLNEANDEGSKVAAKTNLLSSAELLGLLGQDPEAWFKGEASEGGLDAAAIDALIAERGRARENKDFKRGDEIRDELEKNGVLLEDGAQGTTWKRK
jgi:cysteinyl-tRNA synthetase|tara:strand:- start:5496 stop:6890 length:1395 start_codon:yes stop_codon:yes gene_type:complete